MANKVLAIVDVTQFARSDVQDRVAVEGEGASHLLQLLQPFRNSSTVDRVVVSGALVPEHDQIKQAAERQGFEIYRGTGTRGQMLSRMLRLVEPSTIIYIDGRQDAPTSLQLEGLLKFHFGSSNDITLSVHVASFASGIEMTVLSYRALTHLLAEAEACGTTDPIPFDLSLARGLQVSSARQRRSRKSESRAAL